MKGSAERLLTEWRDQNKQQIRFALVVAALIALLLWQTMWLRLRLPLAILLLGQLAMAITLLIRNRSLTGKTATDFSEELKFTVRLDRFEYSCQLIGFAWLGYEFLLATHNWMVALLIGAVYPFSTYWGLARPRMAKRKRQLQLQLHPSESLPT